MLNSNGEKQGSRNTVQVKGCRWPDIVSLFVAVSKCPDEHELQKYRFESLQVWRL